MFPVSARRSQQRQGFIRNAVKYIGEQKQWSDEEKLYKYRAEIKFHYPFGMSQDIDNALKCVFDVLKSRAMYDDKNVTELEAIILENSPKKGIEINLIRLKL